MRFAATRRESPDVTLTPLIDILFIVLLFLVLTATFTEQGAIRISLPETSTDDRRPGELAAGVRIVVDADGRAWVEGDVRSLEEIRARLETIANVEGASVTVSADRRARHGQVIGIVDLVRAAGIRHLEIETVTRRDSR